MTNAAGSVLLREQALSFALEFLAIRGSTEDPLAVALKIERALSDPLVAKGFESALRTRAVSLEELNEIIVRARSLGCYIVTGDVAPSKPSAA